MCWRTIIYNTINKSFITGIEQDLIILNLQRIVNNSIKILTGITATTLLLCSSPNNVEINGVFGHNVVLYTKYKKAAKTYNLPEDLFVNVAGRSMFAYSTENQPMFGIYIRDLDCNTIAHESSHVTTYIMKTLNIKDDEFRAYLTGYLSGQILEVIYGENNSSKKK